MNGLTDILHRAADFLEEVADEVDKQKAEQDDPLNSRPAHGFMDDEKVVLMGPLYFPDGLRGTVDSSAYRSATPYVIPVIDERGIPNGFPAGATLRADLFDMYVRRDAD